MKNDCERKIDFLFNKVGRNLRYSLRERNKKEN